MQQGGAAGGGGQPAGPPAADPLAEIMARIEAFGGPQTPSSPIEMLQVAQEAAALIAPMSDTAKSQKLREIDQMNPAMGDLIRSQLDKFHRQRKQELAAEGEAMQQQQGGMPPAM